MLYFYRLFKNSMEYCHLLQNVIKKRQQDGADRVVSVLSLSHNTFPQLVARRLEAHVVFVEVDLQLIPILDQHSSYRNLVNVTYVFTVYIKVHSCTDTEALYRPHDP